MVKNLPANAGDLSDVGSVPGLRISPGGGMATHSSILARRIPWTKKPGGLQSLGSQRAGHDWSNLVQHSTQLGYMLIRIYLNHHCKTYTEYFPSQIANVKLFLLLISAQDEQTIERHSSKIMPRVPVTIGSYIVVYIKVILIPRCLIYKLSFKSQFLPNTDMNQPWIYMCSPSQSPLPPPSPPDPSGSSQCTSPKHLSHASSLGWWSVSPLIIYLFQCCSLRTSHPRLLPQGLKVCSVHLYNIVK